MGEGNPEEELSPDGGLTEEITEGGERGGDDGPVLVRQAEVEIEEGFALREWTRQNAIRLEEQERKEKEVLKEIIRKAGEYKAESHKKWRIRCENSKSVNREREMVLVNFFK